jgi:hypothetical protein
MRTDFDGQIEVAAVLPLLGETDFSAISDPGRDLDVDPFLGTIALDRQTSGRPMD